ncbi:MAG: 2,3,4,5-tetrahydropyridine-2,6-dicarboxylate N-succinyltransferase, partial [uncultured Gemmatimonadetes bacterium]
AGLGAGGIGGVPGSRAAEGRRHGAGRGARDRPAGPRRGARGRKARRRVARQRVGQGSHPAVLRPAAAGAHGGRRSSFLRQDPHEVRPAGPGHPRGAARRRPLRKLPGAGVRGDARLREHRRIRGRRDHGGHVGHRGLVRADRQGRAPVRRRGHRRGAGAARRLARDRGGRRVHRVALHRGRGRDRPGRGGAGRQRGADRVHPHRGRDGCRAGDHQGAHSRAFGGHSRHAAQGVPGGHLPRPLRPADRPAQGIDGQEDLAERRAADVQRAGV